MRSALVIESEGHTITKTCKEKYEDADVIEHITNIKYVSVFRFTLA